MLVIYHSRGAYSARQAAAMHLGLLPAEPPADPAPMRERLGGDQAMQYEGLHVLGTDPHGHRIAALGRASRPDVTHRAFQAMADVFGIDERSFMLQSVGPVVDWRELGARLAARLGWRSLALRLQLSDVAAQWGPAAEAAATGAQRLAVLGHGGT